MAFLPSHILHWTSGGPKLSTEQFALLLSSLEGLGYTTAPSLGMWLFLAQPLSRVRPGPGDSTTTGCQEPGCPPPSARLPVTSAHPRPSLTWAAVHTDCHDVSHPLSSASAGRRSDREDPLACEESGEKQEKK